jgi:hypothetical protein
MSMPLMIRAVRIVLLCSLLWGVGCGAQEARQDHTCTIDFGGSAFQPIGKDGKNFDTAWGIQVGGGFAVWRSERYRPRYGFYITGNYLYGRYPATPAALTVAKTQEPSLSNATSAVGNYSSITIDPTFRFRFNSKVSGYVSGGSGWLHRGVAFNGATEVTLLHAHGPTLARAASNSGVFDGGGGLNFTPGWMKGFMPFIEWRIYRGTAINDSTTLMPMSVGIRW